MSWIETTNDCQPYRVSGTVACDENICLFTHFVYVEDHKTINVKIANYFFTLSMAS